MSNRRSFFSGYFQKTLLNRFWFAIFLLIGVGVWNGCATSSPTTPKTNESNNLEARMVKALRTHSTSLRQLKSQMEELQQKLDESEQLKRNQNILLLEMEKKFDERAIQMERKLEQYNLKMRKQDGEMERLNKNYREMRLALDKSPSTQRSTATPPPSATKPVAAKSKPAPASRVPPQTTPKPAPVPKPEPSNVDQLFESGWSLFKSEQYLQAIEILQKLRKEHPNHPNAIEAHFLIGDAYYSMQNYQSAAIEFHDFTQQNPQYPSVFDAQWKLAQSLEKSGEIGLALEIYQNIIQNDSPYRDQAMERIKFYESE